MSCAPCLPLPPLLQVPPPWSNLLHDYPQEQPWCMVLSGMSFPCSLDGSRAKRCSNLSTCVLSAYWKDLNNYHRFSGMGFGPETPGKKRDVANSLERDRSSHFGVPQDAN